MMKMTTARAVLLTDIEKMRLNYLVGYGQREDWREYSYLVLGIQQESGDGDGDTL